MDNLEAVLLAEEMDLEAKLAAMPEYRRLQFVRKTLADLKALPRVASASAGNGTDNGAVVPPRSTPAAAQAALEATGHPLDTRALLPIMPKFGKVVGGLDPARNLSSTLSADERFESVDWNGARSWWLAGKPLPNRKEAH
jgi:hypothetical protein